jgi:LysR family transcriptional regulator, glycine cleavage system transcriptional activator
MTVSHLKSLQALELALRQGSLQAAANALWLTPAAVGQRIKALEDYLGVDLLLRGRSGLRATAEMSPALSHLRTAFAELETVATLLNLQRSDQIYVAATSDFVDLWLRGRLDGFRAQYPQIQFSINGEGDAPMRIGPVDCEIHFGASRGGQIEETLFHDFVLPMTSPENTRRIARVRQKESLEGFPLLHVDFYKDDPQAPNWADWIAAHRFKRTEPNRGIRFQRIQPALEAVIADAGVAICGLALLETQVATEALSFPFSVGTGHWTAHAFQARFRPDALLRPQLRRFREWLAAEAGATRGWLARTASARPRAVRRRSARAARS